MEIKKVEFINFLKKATMDGKQKVEETVLDFGKEGLKMNSNSKDKLARAMAQLKTSGFEKYEELGKVGINDIPNFIKVLGRFEETLKVKQSGNVLEVKSGNKKADIELVSENLIKTDTGEPDLEFNDTFEITSKALKDIFSDVQINSDAQIIIKTEPKKVIFTNTGKYKFENVIESETCKGGTEVKFGAPLIDALNNLDGTLEISVRSHYPMKVLEKTDNSAVTIIVAPMVAEEE